MKTMINEYEKTRPRSRRVAKGFLSASIVILLLLLGLRIVADHYDRLLLPMKRVRLYGNVHITEREVFRRIHLDTRSSMLLFNKRQAQKAIFEDARIQSVELTRVYPDTLKIYIKEKEKTAVLLTETHAYWISRDGVILAKAEGTDVRGYPIITLRAKGDDIIIGKRVENYMLTSILESAAVGERGEPDFKNLIDRFWIEQSGIYVLTRGSYYKVYLGDDVTQKKLEKLKALMAVLKVLYQHQDGEKKPLDIDMSFSHAAVRVGELKDAL